MNPLYKPAWKTTEFWLTAGSLLVSLLVTFGAVKAADANLTNDAITQFVTSAANIAAVIYYIFNRSNLKTTHAELIAANPELCTKCGRPLFAPIGAVPGVTVVTTDNKEVVVGK